MFAEQTLTLLVIHQSRLSQLFSADGSRLSGIQPANIIEIGENYNHGSVGKITGHKQKFGIFL